MAGKLELAIIGTIKGIPKLKNYNELDLNQWKLVEFIENLLII